MFDALRQPRALPVLHGFAAGLILLVFAYQVERYWFFVDDAYISFRYAENFADGLGLVWHRGVVVEGYTNFLWVLLLGAGIALGIEPEFLSCVLGIASGLGVLWLTTRLGFFWFGSRSAWPWLAPAALVLNRSFTSWCTSGLETQFFSFLVLAGVVRLLEGLRQEEMRPPTSAAFIFALATLCRPDGGIFTLGVGLCLVAYLPKTPRAWLGLARWCAPYVLVVGSHFLWRYSYYGYWLPNTFYAKVNGAWWDQGEHYFRIFDADYRLSVLLWLVAIAPLGRRRVEPALLLTTTSLYLAYLMYVGGDRMEFRFLVPILPMVYLLITRGLANALDFSLVFRQARWISLGVGLFVATLFLGLTARSNVPAESVRGRHGVASISRLAQYARSRALQGRKLRTLIEDGILPADLHTALGGVGAIPYYTRWPVLDTAGLNDVTIAHQTIEKRGLIAHEHEASLAYMQDEGVELLDLGNRLLHRAEPDELRQVMSKLQRAAKRLNRRSAESGSAARVYPVCRLVSSDLAVMGASLESQEAFAARLPKTQPCPI